jgi:hypothetical protein
MDFNRSIFRRGGEMNNNTNGQRWYRMMAKSLDRQFRQQMIQGLNCSPFEADIVVEKVHEYYDVLLQQGERLNPGQVPVLVVDALAHPNQELAHAPQRKVILTVEDPVEDVRIRQQEGIPALRRHRLCRIAEEAFQQGGLLTLEDISLLFNCGLRTLVYDLAVLRKSQIYPPLRSTVQDMGRATSHRRQIVALWLQGKEYTLIARQTHHSAAAVSNYVEKYKRCVALSQQGLETETMAFLLRLSIPLVKEFLSLSKDLHPVEFRKQELTHFLKKSRKERNQ